MVICLLRQHPTCPLPMIKPSQKEKDMVKITEEFVFRDLKPSNIFMTEDLNISIGKMYGCINLSRN